ncbi:MAG TPA: peptide-methionine (S)-S-oxide reductase MsrA [Ferruginibacter sp.]|nr:peptide-methionine (S)-S-oxide reductase MsrA [Ferruginibacter sp.]HRE62958.1 peptide-methionine (S)-S-oxide reductase MsrA [Ferruginibacter sp.]
MQKLFLFISIAFISIVSCANKKKYPIMTEQLAHNENTLTDTITVGNGCFWCTEAIFQQVEGVLKVESGYSGGETINPTYKEVCTGTTGHAECLNIVYDPTKVSYDELLEIFWETHDPTTLNRQGADEGTQYRSVIFYRNEMQKQVAAAYIKKLDSSHIFDAPIVTTLEPFSVFYKAESYHQNYFNENGEQPYCKIVIRPKVEKFRKLFKDKLKH